MMQTLKKMTWVLPGVAVALGLVFGFSGAARASLVLAPVLTISNTTGTGLENPPFTLGWEFYTDSSITVGALGVFQDATETGLADSYAVGLWSSSGTLLADATVASGTAAPLVDQFRYATVTPVTLAAGQYYYVGALYLDGNDPLVFPDDAADLTNGPGITFDGATYAAGASLTTPTSHSGTYGYFGPNIEEFVPTPLPSTRTMTLIALAVTFVACRWRKRNETLRAVRSLAHVGGELSLGQSQGAYVGG